ncbi:vacuolar ATP synthase subunit G, putative [Entamoeba invadens IP1]|uniref:Vacuolar ATP synthase subunit G, putative n=1 Tax=Entamoeba invadens IP1 TaxID=370355 RepID=A0A0A1UC77_ENTIV|nr:vacuolar ATP synthase subunit G, putative [Entamoeba invadens IP1]ELP89869.1 vacuolar ATP synthase subunit G, putative [Entamoeba invadens IP1]|eukprot:XP_004256640.1 vacuolar ATP synthase subunit G, putative [Entamoeba invadens IP1]
MNNNKPATYLGYGHRTHHTKMSPRKNKQKNVQKEKKTTRRKLKSGMSRKEGQNEDSNAGLKMLMEAEEEAKKVIEMAKAEKVQKLAQSREEAKARVAKMRAEKDDEFKKYLETHNTDLDAQTQSLQVETAQKIQLIASDFEKNKEEAANMLTAIVLNVQ